MTTTTGDPSALKSASSLSGGDLVSRLLAATPPYLYNVPLTPHSFFFSEMLRSFVQAKTEASTAANGASAPRRRKRSWRDTRDRPLELTTKERANQHHQRQQQDSKYYQQQPSQPSSQQQQQQQLHHLHQAQQQPQQQPQDQQRQQQQQQQQPPLREQHEQQPPHRQLHPHPHHHHHYHHHHHRQDARQVGRAKSAAEVACDLDNRVSLVDQSPSYSLDLPLPKTDDDNLDFVKRSKSAAKEEVGGSRRTDHPRLPEGLFAADSLAKVKPEESSIGSSLDRKGCMIGERSGFEDRPRATATGEQPELPSLLADQRKSLDFSRTFLPGLPGTRGCDVLPGVKGFGLPGSATSPEFLPGPLWYPPYPMAQSYPGIDPLHFFIDLRVSGHIWDRKLGERQPPFKSKHCSAFGVPQSKEYTGNRPLNLTRDEATGAGGSLGGASRNPRGTNYILKHLTRTYGEILHARKSSPRANTPTAEREDGLTSSITECVEDSPKRESVEECVGQRKAEVKDEDEEEAEAAEPEDDDEDRNETTSMVPAASTASPNQEEDEEPEEDEDDEEDEGDDDNEEDERHREAAREEDRERKDLRALIGLELVVDCVKEPKSGEPTAERVSRGSE